jgi:hypothetical protein
MLVYDNGIAPNACHVSFFLVLPEAGLPVSILQINTGEAYSGLAGLKPEWIS